MAKLLQIKPEADAIANYRYGDTLYKIAKFDGNYRIFMLDENIWMQVGDMRAKDHNDAMKIFLKIVGED